MQWHPKITIITATFNSGKTLETTIKSISSQTYTNIEYIIIDGESKDGTIDIIDRYEALGVITTWISEKDTGIYNAFNKGLSLSTGDYVVFLGSDDFLFDKFVIEKVVSELRHDTDVYSGLIMCVNEKTGLEYVYDNYFARRGKDVYQMVPHPALFVRTALAKEIRFDESYKIAADLKMFLTLYHKMKLNFIFSDRVVSYFSLSGVSSNNDAADELNRIYSELGIDYRVVHTYRNAIIKFIKKGIIKVMNDSLYKLYCLKIKKYKVHKCSNDFCRWCRR